MSEKLNKLLELMTPEEMVAAMTQPTGSFFSTALAHATSGGSREIEIAQQRILKFPPTTRNADGNLDLSAALGIGNGRRYKGMELCLPRLPTVTRTTCSSTSSLPFG